MSLRVHAVIRLIAVRAAIGDDAGYKFEFSNLKGITALGTLPRAKIPESIPASFALHVDGPLRMDATTRRRTLQREDHSNFLPMILLDRDIESEK